MESIRFFQEFGALYIFTLSRNEDQIYLWTVEIIYQDGDEDWDGNRIGTTSRMLTDSKFLKDASLKEKKIMIAGILENRR